MVEITPICRTKPPFRVRASRLGARTCFYRGNGMRTGMLAVALRLEVGFPNSILKRRSTRSSPSVTATSTTSRSTDPAIFFTYDADMEWDLGAPWYRPTRINHVVSGSDYGWRSGTGKWPAYYEDSLPPVVDIGPGCPTGVINGLGAKFPAKYQDAIYALDWTFGTIYAIHMDARWRRLPRRARSLLFSAHRSL